MGQKKFWVNKFFGSKKFLGRKINKTNVYSVQLGEELTFMPNLRLKIGLTLRGGEGVIDLPP